MPSFIQIEQQIKFLCDQIIERANANITQVQSAREQSRPVMRVSVEANASMISDAIHQIHQLDLEQVALDDEVKQRIEVLLNQMILFAREKLKETSHNVEYTI